MLRKALPVLALVASACAGMVVVETAPEPEPTIAQTAPQTVQPAAPEAAPPPTAPPTTLVSAGWGSVEGLTMFRGSPERRFHGAGPLPTDLEVLWRSPESKMCSESSVGGETKTWCGTGWTGQPVVWEREDGITEVIFGAYDGAVHFLDAADGSETRPVFQTGDLIKGSVTLDPDGYPLLYFGSRDNLLRVVALDRTVPEALWTLNANAVAGIWNNDWDSNPVIVDGVLVEGGENGWFFAIELNRARDSEGLVSVDPKILIQLPGYDDLLLSRVGSNVSIENSVAVSQGVAYFGNSGGRVVGVDLASGEIVFDYWAGDDIDASIVVAPDGTLIVAMEMERFNARSREVGQVIRLDPRAEEPLVWGVAVPPRGPGDGGLWATPALANGVVYVATHPGELLAIEFETGEVVWRDEIGYHAWSSPVIVDDRLAVAVDCEAGGAIRIYSLEDPRSPQEISEYRHGGGCIESTPAVWKGTIYVGSRDGYFYALGGS